MPVSPLGAVVEGADVGDGIVVAGVVGEAAAGVAIAWVAAAVGVDSGSSSSPHPEKSAPARSGPAAIACHRMPFTVHPHTRAKVTGTGYRPDCFSTGYWISVVEESGTFGSCLM